MSRAGFDLAGPSSTSLAGDPEVTEERAVGQVESGDVEGAERGADAAVGTAAASVDSLTEGELRGLLQSFVERRRGEKSGSIEIHEDDVRQVRAAFNSDERLGSELARLLRVVISGGEQGLISRSKYARIF